MHPFRTTPIALALLTSHVASAQTYPVYLLEPETPEAVRAIKYAIHPWLSYLKVSAVYTPGAPLGYYGEIKVDIQPASEVAALTGSALAAAYAQNWVFLDTGEFAGAVIGISDLWFTGWNSKCNSQVVVHEFGHVFGIVGHSTSIHATMYPEQLNCRAVVSLRDVRMLRAPVYGGCKSQLTKEGDLFIPYFAGKEGYFERQSTNTWKLVYLQEAEGIAPKTACATLDTGTMNFTVHHVSAPEYEISAEFLFLGNDTWQLHKVSNIQ
jgi:hypothetical protein